MAFCSYCGTQNRDGSKFCNSCGTRLSPATSIACKVCGATNSTDAVFCDKCGARLGALSSIPGSSTDSVSSLPSGSNQEDPQQPPLSSMLPTDAEAEKSDAPDWLASLRSITPEDESNSYLESPAEGNGGTGSDEETPDWIAHLSAESPLEEEPKLTFNFNQAPDWVQNLSAKEPEEDKPQAEEPGWLKQLRAATSSGGTSAIQGGAGTASDGYVSSQEQEPGISGYTLSTSGTPETGVTGARLPELPDEQFLPEWLIATRRAQQRAEQPVPPQPTVPSTDLPAWLAAADEHPVPEGYTIKEPEAASPAPSIQAPAYSPIRETTPAETPREPVRAQESPLTEMTREEQESPQEIVIPDWIVPTPSTQAAQPEPVLAELPPVEPLASENLPTCMGTLTPAPAQTAPAPLQVSEPPIILPATSPISSEPVETAGPLNGLRGVLPLAAMIARPHAAPIPDAPRDGQNSARLFEEILQETPLKPEPLPAKKPRIIWSMRPLVYLLLALAVLVPFFVPLNLASSALAISHTSAADFYDLIQALPPDSTVLVAFDYEPSLAGEMDPQALVVVQHLIRRQINILALSTFETGPQIADHVLTKAIANPKEYRYGSEFVNLGYLPGHEAGVAQLATRLPAQDLLGQKLSVYPLTVDLKDLSQVALVIELAGTEEPLKMWMEQFQPRVPVRMAAAVSAAVEPKARVYQSAKQLVTVMSGLLGAARYEVLTNQPGQALVSVNAQSTAQLALVLVIILGNVVHWVSRARGKTT